MIKTLLITLSFIILITISFSGTTYGGHEETDESTTLVLSDELHKLNTLYKEGVITEEEFKKAKSILLDPDSDKLKIKKIKNKKEKKKEKKKKLTALERRDLKEAEENKLKEEREQLLAEKKAFREASAEEKERLREEKRQACLDNPKAKGCGWTKVKNILTIWK